MMWPGQSAALLAAESISGTLRARHAPVPRQTTRQHNSSSNNNTTPNNNSNTGDYLRTSREQQVVTANHAIQIEIPQSYCCYSRSLRVTEELGMGEETGRGSDRARTFVAWPSIYWFFCASPPPQSCRKEAQNRGNVCESSRLGHECGTVLPAGPSRRDTSTS